MKLVNRIKENKGSNKGFSLVELIIVIAIMAILVGIVGTQVIPYINRSRVAKDQQILSSFLTDGTSAFSMNAEKATAGNVIKLTRSGSTNTFTITADKDTSVAATAPNTDATVIATFCELNGLAAGTTDLTLSLSSTAGKTITEITITFNTTAISLKTNATGTGNADLYAVDALSSSK